MYTDPFSYVRPVQPMTPEDIERRRQRLQDVGLGDSFLARINDFSGRQVARRDATREAVTDTARDAVMKGAMKAAM